MTRNEVIEMARECGYEPDEVEIIFCTRFAEAVAAREREAIAALFPQMGAEYNQRDILQAIRARAEAPQEPRRAMTDAEKNKLHDTLGGKPEHPTYNEIKLAKRWSETI